MEAMLATEQQDKALGRRSLDLTYLDDIPEERALSGKSSEEKELTRLDSGLGDFDSESSRKTSFSSQGRLSPDFAMSKVGQIVFLKKLTTYAAHLQDYKETNGGRSDMPGARDAAKRRRSGMDMVCGPDGQELESPRLPARPVRLPKIAKSTRASGIWARKISPAGIQYLKMEDEVSVACV
jgi:hypothetical protein